MVRSAGRGKGAAVLATLALALGLAPIAGAASSLGRDNFTLDGKQRAELSYTSEDESMANVIRVRRSGRSYLFTDSEPITAASPCSVTGSTARCGVPGVSHLVRISSGERSDRVSVVGSVPAEVDGGTGNDAVRGGTAGDVAFGGDGNDVLRGSAGGDSLEGQFHNDRLYGSHGNDVLQGDEGRDRLVGGSGRDSLDGGPADDVLRGGRGDDDLAGDDGNDTILGGAGDDRLWATTRERDVVNCGRGFDYAFASRNDRVVGCERVFRVTGRRQVITSVLRHRQLGPR